MDLIHFISLIQKYVVRLMLLVLVSILVKALLSWFFRRIKPMVRHILEDMETSVMPFIRQLLLMMEKAHILQCVRLWNLRA